MHTDSCGWRGQGHGLGGVCVRPGEGSQQRALGAPARAGRAHCQLAQLWGRLFRMASKFCLSARISARSLSKLWICSSCCSDSCSNSLSFPCRDPGGPIRSLRRSSACWVLFSARPGARWVSRDSAEGQRASGGPAPCRPQKPVRPPPETLPGPNLPGLGLPPGSRGTERAVW